MDICITQFKYYLIEGNMDVAKCKLCQMMSERKFKHREVLTSMVRKFIRRRKMQKFTWLLREDL